MKPDMSSICFEKEKVQMSTEDKDIAYVNVEEHLRLVFRDGDYTGFYDPALETVI